jgi:multiple sugar transport system substrate-binding protein/sn-glycerol 3-phosphate transport system substrate-binding protein
VAAGKAPAVAQVGWAFLDYFANNFSYIPPQTIIAQAFPEDEHFLTDHFLPNILELAKNSDGVQVGIPYSISTPVLYINQDLLSSAGLSPGGPKTWEEVIAFAKTIKDKTGKYGFYMQEPADNWATQALIESNGARMMTKVNGKLRASFASREGIEAYQAYADMVVKDKSALHISWNEGVQSFVDGNVGMLYTTIAQRANVQRSAKFNVAAVNSPVWEGKKDVFRRVVVFWRLPPKRRRNKKRLGNLKNIYTVLNLWPRGQSVPVMCRRVKMWPTRKTG